MVINHMCGAERRQFAQGSDPRYFALITALILNNELNTWISTSTIPFNINSADHNGGMAA